MDVIMAIFLVENFAVSRHQYRDRIREQQHPRRKGSGRAIEARVLYAGIFQVNCVHQVMQGDMGIAAAQTSHEWSQ